MTDLFTRHAELVSASMDRPLDGRSAHGDGRSWTLKQVQGDEKKKGGGL